MASSCAALREAAVVSWKGQGLVPDDMATLSMILCTNGLRQLQMLHLEDNGFGDTGARILFDGLIRGSAPSLAALDLVNTELGPAGAEALAAALGNGAMPKLDWLNLNDNPIGKQGMAMLAAPQSISSTW